MNNEVIYNSKSLSNVSIPNFWSRYYIDKFFVVRIANLKSNYNNEIIITSGNAVKIINILIQ